jgi:hypothetical protein
MGYTSRGFLFFIYLTPSVPLSFKGEGEEKERGAETPLKLPIRL